MSSPFAAAVRPAREPLRQHAGRAGDDASGGHLVAVAVGGGERAKRHGGRGQDQGRTLHLR